MIVDKPASVIPEGISTCLQCRGTGMHQARVHYNSGMCPLCGGVGLLGIDPAAPCLGPPGSAVRVATFATRYRNGHSIWDPGDFQYSRDQEPERWRHYAAAESPPSAVCDIDDESDELN
jgi:hypothetical protein